MTKQQKQIIAELRECGVPIPSIAEQLGISANTIKSYCQRHSILPLNKPRRNIRFCLQCQTEIPQTPHHKEKKFCCDKCRQLWWTGHSAIIQRSSQIKLTCPVCGRTFQSYESKHMKNETVDKLFRYQTVMAWVRSLLEKSLITRKEYAKIDTIMVKKYGISSCSIFR